MTLGEDLKLLNLKKTFFFFRKCRYVYEEAAGCFHVISGQFTSNTNPDSLLGNIFCVEGICFA